MTNVMNVQIEMIAPEKWRHDEWLARSENITRGGLAGPWRHDQMSHPDATRARIGPTRNIARRKDSRHICLQKFIHQNAVVGRDACLFGQGSVRTYSHSYDHHVAI